MSADELTPHGSCSALIFSPLVPMLCPWCPGLWSLQQPLTCSSFPFPLPVMVLNFLPLWGQHQHFQLGLLLPTSLQVPPIPGGDPGKAPAREITQSFGVMLPMGGSVR